MLPNIINALMPKRRPDGLAPGLMGDGDQGFYPGQPSDKGWNPGLYDFERDLGITAPQDPNAPPIDPGFSPPANVTPQLPALSAPLAGNNTYSPNPATSTGFYPTANNTPRFDINRYTKMPELPSNIGDGSGRNGGMTLPPSNDAQIQQQIVESRGTLQPDNLVAPPPGFSDLPSPGIDRPQMPDPKKYDESGNLKFEYEKDPNKIVERGLNGELVGKSKWWKRALRGALDGGAAGGIGGAIAGSVIEGFYPKSYQKLRTNEKIGEAQQKVAYMDKRRDEATKQKKLEMETEGIGLKNIEQKINNAYDIVTKSPQWKVAMESKQITPDLAQYFNQAAGVNLTPADWQSVKHEWVNGKPYKVTEFGVSTRDTSLPIKPDEVPRNIDLGGGPLPLTPKSAAPIIASQVNADAQRMQGASTTNANNAIEVAKANNANITKWYSDNLALRLKGAELLGSGVATSGKMGGIAKQMQDAAVQMQRTQDRLQNAGDTDDPVKIQKSLDDQIEAFGKLQAEFDGELGKFNGGQAVLQQIQSASIPKPTMITAPKVKAVQVTKKPMGKTMTKAVVKQAARDHGISYAEAAKQAQSQGYTIQ